MNSWSRISGIIALTMIALACVFRDIDSGLLLAICGAMSAIAANQIINKGG